MLRTSVLWLASFAAALAVMVLLGSIAHSLFVQHAWSLAAGQAAGSPPVAIPIDERLGWIAHDLVGLEPLYGLLTAIALSVAFVVAGPVARFTGMRTIVFAVAGAVAIFVLFTATKAYLGTVGLFGARGEFGLSAQMLAGLMAGLTFAALSRRRG
jgi:hypothetical protein